MIANRRPFPLVTLFGVHTSGSPICTRCTTSVSFSAWLGNAHRSAAQLPPSSLRTQVTPPLVVTRTWYSVLVPISGESEPFVVTH